MRERTSVRVLDTTATLREKCVIMTVLLRQIYKYSVTRLYSYFYWLLVYYFENVYLHWLVKAPGKEHGNTPNALDCEKNPEESPVLNWNFSCHDEAVFECVSYQQPASASQSPQTAHSLCCPLWIPLQSSRMHRKLNKQKSALSNVIYLRVIMVS